MADLAPSDAAGSTAAGSTWTTPRGQLKLSARPLGAATASSVLSPTVAPGLSPGPPSSTCSTCSEPTFAPVRGSTGPAIGRTDPPALPFLPGCSGSAGTGRATGTL